MVRNYGHMSYEDNYQDCVLYYLIRLKWNESSSYYRKSLFQYMKNKEKREQVRFGLWKLDLGPIYFNSLIVDHIIENPIDLIKERSEENDM